MSGTSERVTIAVGIPINQISSGKSEKKKSLTLIDSDDEMTSKIRSSSDMGRVKSIIQRNELKIIHKAAVEKANLECQRITGAGENARRRQMEGLEIKQSHQDTFAPPKSVQDDIIVTKNDNKDIGNNQREKKVGEYRVGEYHFKDYSFVTSSSGQNREYKSFYD